MKKIIQLNKKLTAIFLISIFIVACDSTEDAARIVVGNSNTITSVDGDLQYQKEFVVQVTGTDGAPAPNTTVTVKLKNLNYYKGIYVVTNDGWGVTSYPLPVGFDPLIDPLPPTHECDAEDINNNATLDVINGVSEDLNGNGRLDPTNAATIAAHSELTPTITPGTNMIITDDSGFGYFSLVYPKSEGLWSKVQITVSAKVSGTESKTVFEEKLNVALSDVSNVSISPPGGTSGSYGIVADCSDPM